MYVSNCYCLLSDIKPSKSERERDSNSTAIEIQSLFMFSLLGKSKAETLKGEEKEKGIFILHYYRISIWPKSQTILELEKADQSKEIKNGLLLVGFFFDKGRSR